MSDSSPSPGNAWQNSWMGSMISSESWTPELSFPSLPRNMQKSVPEVDYRWDRRNNRHGLWIPWLRPIVLNIFVFSTFQPILVSTVGSSKVLYPITNNLDSIESRFFLSRECKEPQMLHHRTGKGSLLVAHQCDGNCRTDLKYGTGY